MKKHIFIALKLLVLSWVGTPVLLQAMESVTETKNAFIEKGFCDDQRRGLRGTPFEYDDFEMKNFFEITEEAYRHYFPNSSTIQEEKKKNLTTKLIEMHEQLVPEIININKIVNSLNTIAPNEKLFISIAFFTKRFSEVFNFYIDLLAPLCITFGGNLQKIKYCFEELTLEPEKNLEIFWKNIPSEDFIQQKLSQQLLMLMEKALRFYDKSVSSILSKENVEVPLKEQQDWTSQQEKLKDFPYLYAQCKDPKNNPPLTLIWQLFNKKLAKKFPPIVIPAFFHSSEAASIELKGFEDPRIQPGDTIREYMRREIERARREGATKEDFKIFDIFSHELFSPPAVPLLKHFKNFARARGVVFRDYQEEPVEIQNENSESVKKAIQGILTVYLKSNKDLPKTIAQKEEGKQEENKGKTLQLSTQKNTSQKALGSVIPQVPTFERKPSLKQISTITTQALALVQPNNTIHNLVENLLQPKTTTFSIGDFKTILKGLGGNTVPGKGAHRAITYHHTSLELRVPGIGFTDHGANTQYTAPLLRRLLYSFCYYTVYGAPGE